MGSNRYRINVNIRLEQVDDTGLYTGQHLNISEEFGFTNLNSFTEVAQVLGRFHDLGEELKAETSE